jgi:hypothetical protein
MRFNSEAADHSSHLSLPGGPSGLRFARTSLLVPEILQEGQKVRRFDSSPRFQRATSKRSAGGSANPQMLGFARLLSF